MSHLRIVSSKHPGRVVGAAAMAAVACATLVSGASATTTRPATKHSGNVDVLYAASLQQIMTDSIGPAFQKATGYTFVGFSGASGTLATEIKSGVQPGDVFISANEATNSTLYGVNNGLQTFVIFGQSPLVIGYYKGSQYAATIQHQPWFEALLTPGIRVGRTDPTIDPKGKLTVQAVSAAEQIYNTTAIGSLIASSSNIYPEQSLVGLVQSGQLDAGFFYSVETKAAGLPTVKLGSIKLAATYTIAPLQNDPNPAGAAAFTAFLLGKQGQKLLKRDGIVDLKPRVNGPVSALPKSVRTVLHS